MSYYIYTYYYVHTITFHPISLPYNYNTRWYIKYLMCDQEKTKLQLNIHNTNDTETNNDNVINVSRASVQNYLIYLPIVMNDTGILGFTYI